MQAFLSIPEDIVDEPGMHDPMLAYLWLYMACRSSREQRRVVVSNGKGSKVYNLRPGELVFSRRKFAEELGWSASSLRNRVDRLVEHGLISITEDHLNTIVFVEKINAKSISEDEERTTIGPPLDQLRTSIRNDIEDTFDEDIQAISISVAQTSQPTAGRSDLFGEPEQPVKKKPASKTAKFDPREYPIPQSLDTQEFREAWTDFCQHRTEKRKPLTETTCKKSMKWFLEIGVKRAIASLEYTTRMGWQGIREPEPEVAGKQQQEEPRKMTKLA